MPAWPMDPLMERCDLNLYSTARGDSYRSHGMQGTLAHIAGVLNGGLALCHRGPLSSRGWPKLETSDNRPRTNRG